jgi:hypothetical protein
MIAGSYYLHTRSKIFGNKTWWLAGLIGFRIGAAAYNILVFYQVALSFVSSSFIALVTFLLMGTLLARTEDVSKRGIVEYFRMKLDSWHHRYIQRGFKAKTVPEEKTDKIILSPEPPDSMSLWLKRAGYLSLAVLVFVSTPYFLAVLADFTGVGAWSEVFGPLVFWNEVSGPAFIMGFIFIVGLSAIMMYAILKAFSVREGAW